MGSIEIIDFFIEGHLKLVHGLEEKYAKWDDVGDGTPKSMGKCIAETHLELAKGLEFLKEVLLKEKKVTKCKHLKKDRDVDPDGVVYCMNCNSDLPDKMKIRVSHPNKTSNND